MAQFLMLASDIGPAGRTDGDPVSVVDDDHIWSENEDKRVWLANGHTSQSWPGLFEIISIPTMPLNIAQRINNQFIRGAIPGESAYLAPDLPDRIVVLGPHRWQLGKQSRLPPPLANQLNQNGFIEIPYDIPTINNYMIDRQTIPSGPNQGQEMDDFISNDPVRFWIDGAPVFESSL